MDTREPDLTKWQRSEDDAFEHALTTDALSKRHDAVNNVDDFMYMWTVGGEHGDHVDVFKHKRTRRYLYVAL